MEIFGQQVIQFLGIYGYWIIIPLMFLEGPTTTIFAGILSSLGVLNVWIVLFLAVLSDVVGDVGLYEIGKKWGFGFVNRFGKYIGVTKSRILKMEKYFSKHGGKTVFMAKTTTGLCLITFITAGITEMDFKKFLKYSILGGVIWSGGLVFVGYFYGYMWKEIIQYIEWAGWLIIGLTIVSAVALSLTKKRKARNIFTNNYD